MSDHTVYLDGCGTMEKTKELVDAMWGAVGLAIAGGAAGTISLMLFAAAVIFSSTFSFIIAFLLAYVSWRLTSQWLTASRNLKEHTRRMNAETALRGKGWARS